MWIHVSIKHELVVQLYLRLVIIIIITISSIIAIASTQIMIMVQPGGLCEQNYIVPVCCCVCPQNICFMTNRLAVSMSEIQSKRSLSSFKVQ